MDVSTIIGLGLGVALVLASILLGESPRVFLDLPSIMIVFGGTLGVTLMRNSLRAVVGMLSVVAKAFTVRLASPTELVHQIVDMSRKARKESLLSLEKVEVQYPFLAKGMSLCVDGLEPASIRSILETDVVNTTLRHKQGQHILEGIASAAPAFGMIGTLIGLVQMLTAMSDPALIGKGMAIALLTTLYGALIANVFALPLADKLRLRSVQEVLNMSVCVEGVLGIVQGDHPASIDEKLKAFIAPKLRKRDKVAVVAKAGAAAGRAA